MTQPAEPAAAPATPPQPPSYEAARAAAPPPPPPPIDYFAPRIRDFEPTSCGITVPEPDPDAESLLPSYAAAARPWGRYKSEEDYLNALRAFVREKEYADPAKDGAGNSVGLIGFYGTKTGADYASRPGLREGRSKKMSKNNRTGEDTAARGSDTTTRNTGIDPKASKKSSIKDLLRRNRASPRPE